MIAYVLCIVIGFLAGVINVVAAGGSFLVLPLLLFLGLPAAVANGTNRVGVLAQNMSAVVGFHQHQVMEWRWALRVSVPGVVGALLGVWTAIEIPEVAFRRVLSVIMLAMTLWTLLRRSPARSSAHPLTPPSHWTMVLGFFFVGFYAGFIQAGVGFLVLAMTTIAGMDLVRGNAVKVLSVMMFTIVSLAVFAGTGHVDWPLGIALAIGNTLGGVVGVRLAVLRGHRWLEHVVTATIIIFAILLWTTD